MAWSPGNRSGGGVWRSLALYTANKAAKAAAQSAQPTITRGSLDVSLGLFTSVATGVLATVLDPRTASAAITLGSFTSSASGQLKIKGSLAATLDAFLCNATSGPLQKPVVTNVTASGVSPVILSITDGDYVAGKSLHWEFAASLTPSKNADGSYTTPTQSGVTPIDGDSWARLDLALGYTDPSGVFAFHCRVLRDNENGTAVSWTDTVGNTRTSNFDVSDWSTDYTDSITTAAAILVNSTGPSKSQYLDVASPYFQWVHKNNVGQLCGVRSTLGAVNDKWHAEFRIDHINTNWFCGIVDAYVSGDTTRPSFATFQPLGSYPGSSGVKGFTLSITTAASALTGGVVPAANDIVIIEGVKSTGAIKVYYWDDSAGALVNGGSPTSSFTVSAALMPTEWRAFGGGARGNGTVAGSDAGTFNPGSSAFVMTPSSGYSYFA